MCQASIREMVAPACLVILSPLAAGTFFGVQAVFGLLTGSLGSSVQLAISMSNSGGAWDNCKKYIKNGFSEVGWAGEGVGREEVEWKGGVFFLKKLVPESLLPCSVPFSGRGVALHQEPPD